MVASVFLPVAFAMNSGGGTESGGCPAGSWTMVGKIVESPVPWMTPSIAVTNSNSGSNPDLNNSLDQEDWGKTNFIMNFNLKEPLAESERLSTSDVAANADGVQNFMAKGFETFTTRFKGRDSARFQGYTINHNGTGAATVNLVEQDYTTNVAKYDKRGREFLLQKSTVLKMGDSDDSDVSIEVFCKGPLHLWVALKTRILIDNAVADGARDGAIVLIVNMQYALHDSSMKGDEGGVLNVSCPQGPYKTVWQPNLHADFPKFLELDKDLAEDFLPGVEGSDTNACW